MSVTRAVSVTRAGRSTGPGHGPLKVDFAIVGAGCAGLSLAAHLAITAPGRSIAVVDPRTTFARDRTWCYWNVHDHLFSGAATHRWARWRVATSEADVVGGSSRYAYHHLPADAFYRAALALLEPAPHVTLMLGERVTHVGDAGDAVLLATTRRRIRAGVVLDSRALPPPEPAAGDTTAVRLVQHFGGAFVRAGRPVFDPTTAMLMDFRRGGGDATIAFTYLLPFNTHEALVESTVIGEHAPAAGEHERRVGEYLARVYPGTRFATLATEHGAIPMSTAAVRRRRSERVYAIGVGGGLVKPSTGYAFLAIQRDSAEFARRLAGAALPEAPTVRGARATFLDQVFLSYLRRHPERAPALFARLFASADGDAIVRFLSDTPTFTDQLRVAGALPFWPFAAEAVRSRRLWLPRS